MSKYLRARYLAKPLIRARDRRVCRRRVGDEILQVQTPQQELKEIFQDHSFNSVSQISQSTDATILMANAG